MAPGLIRSESSRKVWENEQILASFTADIPLRRMGVANEIGGAVAFFASPAAGYVTGTILPVDGSVVSLPSPPGHNGPLYRDANIAPVGAEP